MASTAYSSLPLPRLGESASSTRRKPFWPRPTLAMPLRRLSAYLMLTAPADEKSPSLA